MSGAYCGDRDFDSLKSGVDHLIAIADFLIEVTTVPPGQVPRDVGKWQAKLVAMNLVAEFSALAGKLGKGGKSGEPRVKGEKDITNDIASLIYEILTGREGADILEQSEAYAPPAIKTPFASDLPKQRKAATRRGEREVAELRKLTLKPLTKRK